jgi:orotidine-5'-phosphate decarboxylase
MHFADALTAKVRKISPVCVGLDPQMEKLPKGIRKDLEGMKTFCRGIMDAVQNLASCIKPNLAFFETLGWEGMKLFFELCSEAKERGFIVIADGKRSDIGNTAAAYAAAYLGVDKPIDALTVNAYLGSDGVSPFLRQCSEHDKGIFVLVKTSNASSGELQDLPVGDEMVHEHLSHLVESWGKDCLGMESKLSCVGAVVGAPYPEELKYLRTTMPHIPFLIPGYGAQGGTAREAALGFIPDGTGAIVNASRSIMYASAGEDWKEAAQHAAEAMAADLKEALNARKRDTNLQ